MPRNERIGQVSVVRVNGPLEYHDDGFGDSYEWICSRVEKAMTGQDACEAYEREHRWDDDYEPMTAAPPACVVMRIDSPGGVVAGLEQTVNRLRALSAETGIPLYAYVDETAYSAAYALCCACSRVVLPSSGFCGSIGVISTMVDQTAKDKKDGYKFVILTSGERKADGHPHAPITDEMVAEEQPRVATLAKQFFSMVRRARGIPTKEVAAFQAKRFLGKEAVSSHVADEIKPWAQFISELNTPPTTADDVAVSGSPEKRPVAKTKKSVHTESRNSTSENLPMDAVALAKAKADLEAINVSLKTERDPVKLLALAESYKKTKHMIEKHETEEGDEEDEEEQEEEEGAKGDETDRSDDADEEDEDDEDDEDEDDAKKSTEERKGKRAALIAKYLGRGKIDQIQAAALAKQKLEAVKMALGIKPKGAASVPASKPPTVSAPDAALAALVREITGKRSAADAGAALRGLVAGVAALKADNLERTKRERKASRDKAVTEALSARRVTPSEAKVLRTKKLAFVEQFLEMRPNAVVLVDGEPMPIPDLGASGMPKDVQAIIAAAQAAMPGLKVEDVASEMRKGANGAGKVI